MMFTWDNFEWFALVSIVLWAAGAGVALFSRERRRWAILLTALGMLVFATFIIGTADLPALALPLDPQLLDGGGDGLRPHQHSETRNPRPNADARPAEPVVHPACYGLHVLLLGTGVRLHSGLHGTHQTSGRLPRSDRQAGLHRTGLSDRRHAHRFDLGQGGLGPLLELGPEGDLGRSDVGWVSALRPPASVPQKRLTAALLDSDRLVPGAADVLVRGQLPPGGPAECSHVFTFLVI